MGCPKQLCTRRKGQVGRHGFNTILPRHAGGHLHGPWQRHALLSVHCSCGAIARGPGDTRGHRGTGRRGTGHRGTGHRGTRLGPPLLPTGDGLGYAAVAVEVEHPGCCWDRQTNETLKSDAGGFSCLYAVLFTGVYIQIQIWCVEPSNGRKRLQRKHPRTGVVSDIRIWTLWYLTGVLLLARQSLYLVSYPMWY